MQCWKTVHCQKRRGWLVETANHCRLVRIRCWFVSATFVLYLLITVRPPLWTILKDIYLMSVSSHQLRQHIITTLLRLQMPHHLISDACELINEIPTVLIYCIASQWYIFFVKEACNVLVTDVLCEAIHRYWWFKCAADNIISEYLHRL